jgi:hypothetical protein
MTVYFLLFQGSRNEGQIHISFRQPTDPNDILEGYSLQHLHSLKTPPKYFDSAICAISTRALIPLNTPFFLLLQFS